MGEGVRQRSDISSLSVPHFATLGWMAKAPRLTINISEEERKRLVALASLNERSYAAEARIAIRYYLDNARTDNRRI